MHFHQYACILLTIFFIAFGTGVSVSGIRDRMLEFCLLETFRPECWRNEVIVIQEAIYGRRHIGKCIDPEEVEGVEDNPQYIGCNADVLSLLDAKCSGKKQCEVAVPDADLEQTEPCRKGLKMFLEVRYTCVEVVEPDRSCVVSVTSNPLHIAAAADAGGDSWSKQSNIGCGTKTQPWMLEAPAGQRINISLLDFTAAARGLTSQHLSRSTSHIITSSSSNSSSGSCADEKHQYGYIIDKSSVNKKNVSVCHSRSNRQTQVHLSTSNTLQLVFTNDPDENFLLKVRAVGCSNLIPPEDAWIKREDDKVIIGCYTSRQTWQLRCHDGRWTGVVSNCSTYAYNHVDVKVQPISSSDSGFLHQYQTAFVLGIGLFGLATCLMIICCGVVCLYRFYAVTSRRYNMLSHCSISQTMKHQQQQQQFVRSDKRTSPFTAHTSQHPQNGDITVTAAERQYFVLDAE